MSDQPFVAGPPLPEHMLVGRRGVIDDLERRVQRSEKLLLLRPRREGKTSVARAALARVAATDGIAVELDLSSIQTSVEATRLLRRQVVPRLVQLMAAGSATGSLAGVAADERAVDEHLNALDGFVAVLDTVARSFPTTKVALFLDEAHFVADWHRAQQLSLRAFLRNDVAIGFIIASSEQSALDRLLDTKQVFEYVGQRFSLPRVDLGDWRAALRQQFRESGREIEEDAMELLLEATKGHPYCTMLAAREARYIAEDLGGVSVVAVEAAFTIASADAAWALRDAYE